jgi:hypothetical protein
MNDSRNISITIPITKSDQKTAQRFAQEQPNREKAIQVYKNTLAVLVTKTYLEWLGIPVELEASHSWNLSGQLGADVADLKIKGAGHLECRAMWANTSVCHIPPEVWHDRIGYVVVQIEPSFKAATILGFVPEVFAEELLLDELQPLDALLQHLSQLQEDEPALEGVWLTRTPALMPPTKQPDDIAQRVTKFFRFGWQKVEDLLNPSQRNLVFQFRSLQESGHQTASATSFRRAKLIDLGMHLAEHTVALVVEFCPALDGSAEIRLQVHPMGNRKFLPPDLQLILLEGTGKVASTVQARNTDNYIQLKLRGQAGEHFGVTVALNQLSVTERFEI